MDSVNESLSLQAPEEELAEINERAYIDFHLEVYDWYDGVDRTGAS